MAEHDTPVITLPDDLSDEAAARMLEVLHDITRILERHYAGQLLRYHHRPDERQLDLWSERDPPF